MDRLAPQISSLWIRDLYYAYHQALIQKYAGGNASRILRRDTSFFISLAEHIACRDELTGVNIVRRLGHALVAKHARTMSFLTAAGYIHTHQDPDYDFEWQLSRIRALINTAPAWSHPVLTRFTNHMIHTRDRVLNKRCRQRIPIKAKSLESAVRGAIFFLIFADKEGIRSVQGLNQDLLEIHIGMSRKQGLSVRAFIRHLRKHERTFSKLRAPKSKVEFHLHGKLSESRRISLIQELGQLDGNSCNQRWALVSLFALLYMQPPHRSVAMLADQIRDDGEAVSVLFAKHWIELDPITQDAVRRWLRTRRETSCFERTGESRWLFPGRHASNHAHASTLQPWLRRFRVGARGLVKTSISSWIERGIQNPQLLVEAFGVSRATATLYCEQLGMFNSAQSKHAFETLAT